MSETPAPIPKPPPLPGPLFCPACGYDMRARFGDQCPECGEVWDEPALRRAQIPWSHRAGIGRYRAFWRTVWRVTFQTRRFCHAASQPVDFEDAKKFRRRVIGWLYMFVLLIAAVPLFVLLANDEGYLLFDMNAQGPMFGPVGLALRLGWLPASLLFLIAWTGVHTYWFHPRHLPLERQNRAVALSYYACAPLVWLPVVPVLLVLAVGAVLIAEETRSQAGYIIAVALAGAGGVVGLGCAAAFWNAARTMAGRIADRGPAGRWSLMLLLPVIWAALFALIVIGLPFVVGYTWLMIVAW